MIENEPAAVLNRLNFQSGCQWLILPLLGILGFAPDVLGLSSGGGALCGAEMAPLRSAAVSIGGRKYARRQAEHTRQNST